MKSRGAPVPPVAWFFPRRQCSRKSRRNVPPGPPAVCGPPTRAVGKRPPDAVDRVVVQLVVLLGRALPVADVGLVPDLPPPALDLGATVPLHGVLHPLLAEATPLVVVLRRVGLAPVHLRPLVRRRVVQVEVGARREGLGHEADLDERLHAAREQRVEDAVEDRPVVDGASLGVLAVGVRRAPLEGRRAVAARQQVVRADEDRVRAELRELAEQPLPVLHVGEVRLVVAEEAPEGPHLPDVGAGVHPHRDREGRRRAGRRRLGRGGRREHDGEQGRASGVAGAGSHSNLQVRLRAGRGSGRPGSGPRRRRTRRAPDAGSGSRRRCCGGSRRRPCGCRDASSRGRPLL